MPGQPPSVASALDLAEKQELSCGILYISLRDGLVFPAAQALNKKGVHIIFYTGQADPEGVKRDWPDADVLIKPVPAQTLLGALISACMQPAAP